MTEAPDPGRNAAILDAIDIYYAVQREAVTGYGTRAMVDAMMSRAGRGDEEREPWPSAHRQACTAFVESLAQNGYELTRRDGPVRRPVRTVPPP